MPKRRSRGSANRVKRELQQAAMLLSDGLPEAALERLLPLQRRYPRNVTVLRFILHILLELEDWSSYLFYGVALLPLETGRDERMDLLNNLTASCQQLDLAFLCEKYGRLLLAEPVDKDTAKSLAGFLELAEPLFAGEISKVRAVTDLGKAESLKLLHEHEWCRFLVEHQYFDAARPLLTDLAAEAPQFAPVQNNLTLVLFVAGDLDKALVIANQVLSIEPDNYHALANLSRVHFFSGNLADARAAADRLLQLQIDTSDLPFKKIETLTYLGADEQILAVYQAIRKPKTTMALPQIQNAAATAHYRLGNEQAAWKLWRTAASHDQTGIAKQCLDEKELAPGERHVPWYIPFAGWFLRGLEETLSTAFDDAGNVRSMKRFNQAIQTLLQRNPNLISLLPHMLTLGDQRSRIFATMLCKHINTVETAAMLRDFGLSPYGPDESRMDALLFVSENFPELLPANKHVTKWVNGKQQEIILLDFSISFEPGPLDFPLPIP